MRHRRLAPAALLLAACSDPVSPGPDTLHVVTAPAPVGVPGWALIDTIRVQVLDDDERPQEGVAVSWSVAAGGGSVEPLGAATGPDGIAAAVWTLGTTPGANQLTVAAAPDLTASFTVEGTAFRTDVVAASYSAGCGLVGGSIWCWGGREVPASAPVSNANIFGVENESPVLIADDREYVGLALRHYTLCALDTAGSVWCFEIGISPVSPPAAPVAGVPALRSVSGSSWGFVALCGLAAADSTAWCWDDGGAAPVSASPAFAELAVGGGETAFSACGRLADSTAVCWGAMPPGDGSGDESDTPVPVAGDHRFAEIAAGEHFACGRKASGEVWCWGRDWDVAHADLPSVLSPALALTGASQIGAHGRFMLALTPAGVSRWVGAGYEDAALDPAPPGPIADVSAGGCVRLADGQTWCLGEMWDLSTVLRWFEYLPVPPVRP